jgi:NAD+ kinase
MQMDLDSLRSPCFVHKTFGGSIDLERVLDECRAEKMTHHNLLQTATGVREVARQLGISFIILLIQGVLL